MGLRLRTRGIIEGSGGCLRGGCEREGEERGWEGGRVELVYS